jgi:hypothetical protein
VALIAPPVATASGWSAPVPVDPYFAGTSISCAQSGFCAAVAADGYVAIRRGGAWRAPVRVDANGLTSVSCPTATFCVAVDSSGNELIYDGSGWSGPAPIDRHGRGLTTVSCVSSSFCVAVNAIADSLFYDGRSWSRPAATPANQWEAISCASRTLCVGTGEQEDNEGNVASGDAFIFNGHRWFEAVTDNDAGLVSVSCPTTKFCAALDNEAGEYTYRGGRWRTANPTASAAALSCPSASLCETIGEHGETERYNGRRWSYGPTATRCATTAAAGAGR